MENLVDQDKGTLLSNHHSVSTSESTSHESYGSSIYDTLDASSFRSFKMSNDDFEWFSVGCEGIEDKYKTMMISTGNSPRNGHTFDVDSSCPPGVFILQKCIDYGLKSGKDLRDEVNDPEEGDTYDDTSDGTENDILNDDTDIYDCIFHLEL